MDRCEPSAHDLVLLQDTQQLDLRAERQIADLVEEERAPVGGLEPSGLARQRARERALLVAEQLALDQRFGEGAAVDGHERPRGARRKLVQVARDDLLAGAGLADDEDGGLAGRQLLDARQEGTRIGSSNTNALARPDSDGFADFGRVRTDITRPLEPSLACPPSASCCAKVTAERGLASILSRVPGRSFNRSNRNSRDLSPYRPWSAQPSGPLFTIQAAVLLSDSDAPDHAAPTRPVGSTRARSILLGLEQCVAALEAIPPVTCAVSSTPELSSRD